MQLLIGLDLGTSTIKGILISLQGDRIASAKRETHLLRPEPGFVELSAEEHYGTVCDVIHELASNAPPGGTITALALSGATGNTVLLDENGAPQSHGISWLDERCVGKGHEVLPGLDFDQIHDVVGWPWAERFPLAHLAYLKKYRRPIYRKASHYGMLLDYCYLRLTGKRGLDFSTATTFYLQDQQNRCWHMPFLNELEIPPNSLPDLHPSGQALEYLSQTAAFDTGLDTGTLVVLGAFDHPSAARGTGAIHIGDLLLSCGTSWVGFYPIANRQLPLSLELLIDPFLQPRGPWGTMFSLARIGVNIEQFIDAWVISGTDRTAGRSKYAVFNDLARGATPGAHGLFINPFRESQKSLNDTKLDRLPAAHTREDIARAIMEGAAFELKRKILELAHSGIEARQIAFVGGPSQSPIWPQIVSDITGLELSLSDGQTAGAVGAAMLAGIGAGIFANEEEAIDAMRQTPVVISPDENSRKRYSELFKLYLENREKT